MENLNNVEENNKRKDIASLDLAPELIAVLKKDFRISTIGELLEIPYDVICEIANAPELNKDIYSNGRSYLHDLRNEIHRIGEVFIGEYQYDGLDLPKEVALVKISDLKLPNKTLKNILTRKGGIYTLGDLLSTDYKSLSKIRTMGDTNIIALKEYIHSLGYVLLNEEPTIKEIIEELRARGEQVLEDVGISSKAYRCLYRNNIFTVEDLKNYGPDVFNLASLGSFRGQKLAESMQELGIKFNGVVYPEPMTQPLKINPIDDYIQKVKDGNEEIKKRIEDKKTLIDEYAILMEERKQLLQKEQELDARIQDLSNEKGTDVGYGRK